MTRIRVTASRSYDVLIQPGLLDRAGEELRAVLPGARTPHHINLTVASCIYCLFKLKPKCLVWNKDV